MKEHHKRLAFSQRSQRRPLPEESLPNPQNVEFETQDSGPATPDPMRPFARDGPPKPQDMEVETRYSGTATPDPMRPFARDGPPKPQDVEVEMRDSGTATPDPMRSFVRHGLPKLRDVEIERRGSGTVTPNPMHSFVRDGPDSGLPPSPGSHESRGDLYAIISQVGEGTFGKVYKARNTVTKVYVALKRIRMEAERDGFPVTAMREIKLLQSLRHKNVVRLYEMMVSNG